MNKKNINKRVLITGSSKGIGSRLAIFLSRYNYDIYLVARNEKNLIKTINKCENKERHSYFVVDVRKQREFEKFLIELTSKKIDILINNIGGALGKKEFDSNISDWEEVWNFNVGVPIQINNTVLKNMRKNKWGRIVHISSSYADNGGITIKPYGGSPMYVCSKAYLNMYIKTISRELINHGIVVSGVLPGPVNINGKHWHKMKKNNKKLFNQYLENFLPSKKLAEPDDILPFIKLLISEEAKYAAGTLIKIDGGSII